MGVAVSDDYRIAAARARRVSDRSPRRAADERRRRRRPGEGTLVAGAQASQPGAPQPANVPPPVIAPADASKLVTAADAAPHGSRIRDAARARRAGERARGGDGQAARGSMSSARPTCRRSTRRRSPTPSIAGWVRVDSLRLELEYPFGNNVAEGRYAQRRAEASQRAIEARICAARFSSRSCGRRAGAAGVGPAGTVAPRRRRVAEDDRRGRSSASEPARPRLIDTLLTEQQLVDARLALVPRRPISRVPRAAPLRDGHAGPLHRSESDRDRNRSADAAGTRNVGTPPVSADTAATADRRRAPAVTARSAKP